MQTLSQFVFVVAHVLWAYLAFGRVSNQDGSSATVDVSMPGVKPETADQYSCTAVRVKEPGFILRFLPTANADRVHHMLLFGCVDMVNAEEGTSWDCAGSRRCSNGERIIYAWARNAPSLSLPDDVGVALGSQNGGPDYLILQVHYAQVFQGDVWDFSGVRLQLTSEQPLYLAAIYLFASGGDGGIPAHQETYAMNMTCDFNTPTPIHAFAYRPHAHGLGRVISAYRYRNEKWQQIGKGNPQWPQMFYQIKDPVEILPGDQLAAQCIYETTHMMHTVHIGMTGHNEMCNFYMYYYMNATLMSANPPSGCYFNGRPSLMEIYPREASEPLPPNPALEEAAKTGEKPFDFRTNSRSVKLKLTKDLSAFFRSRDSRLYPRLIRSSTFRSRRSISQPAKHRPRRAPYQNANYGSLDDGNVYTNDRKKNYNYAGGYQNAYQDANVQQIDLQPIQYGGVATDASLGGDAWPQQDGGDQSSSGQAGQNYAPPSPAQRRIPVDLLGVVTAGHVLPSVYEQTGYPSDNVRFGQVGGLSVDSAGNVWVFHRGSRSWSYNSFDERHVYQNMAEGPIQEDVIVALNSTGSVVNQWGSNLFYMPHDIFLDSKDNVWITDVALHQVLKFPVGSHSPVLTLGEQFVPGQDRGHFCKPAGVTVTSDGTIYVADGYCNGRIMSFSSDGTYLASWGRHYDGHANLANGLPQLGLLNIAHSITADEGRGLLYVADRENGRLQIVSMKNGSFLAQVQPKAFAQKVFAVKYCPDIDTVFVANGITATTDVERLAELRVFALNPQNWQLMYSWRPKKGFSAPHALAVGHDSRSVFVGEIGPNRVWKFLIDSTQKVTTKPTSATNAKKPAAANAASTSTSISAGLFSSANPGELALILGTAVALPILCAFLICACIRFRKQGGFRSSNILNSQKTYRNGHSSSYKGKNGSVPLLNGWNKSHKGFQPLSTEDIDGIDDVTDESENEDTLYTAAPNKNPHKPLTA